MLEGDDKDAFLEEYEMLVNRKEEAQQAKTTCKVRATEKRKRLYRQISTYKAFFKYLVMMGHSCTIVANCTCTTSAFTVLLLPMMLYAIAGQR